MTSNKSKLDRTGLEIAVIGMSGRFPGARNIQEYWHNLKTGKETIRFFTDEELIQSGEDQQLINQPHYIKSNGYLDDVNKFDASFFGYTRREAEMMDPQIRIFHECVWEAIEDAGYNIQTYKGKIGLFAGASPNLLWQKKLLEINAGSLSEQFAAFPLTDKDFMNTHISYKLNLKGPSVSISSACSTSLVAIHTACRSLLTGECEIALAGGVSAININKKGYLYQEGMILSSDGHCRPFDEKASGTVEGSGAGVVVLKPLDRAIADGDHIYAMIKGSAVNNDGNRKMGYTAPSIDGQLDVIRSAQRMSQVSSESITYIEAHGTGTSLGDPIEIEALKSVFNSDHKQYCRIGSVKSNIGHLDAAAGVASFIKTVLALNNKEIPPSLNYTQSNPNIDFDNSAFVVNKELVQWHNEKYPLRAGVSSFGIGGTNVHVILEEAPILEEPAKQMNMDQEQLIVLSAKDEEALNEMSNLIQSYCIEHPNTNISDIAYTLNIGRSERNYRKYIITSNIDHLIQTNQSLELNGVPINIISEEMPPILFMFSGQGSQYVQMGLGLYRNILYIRKTMDYCFEMIRPFVDGDLKQIIYVEEGSLISNQKLNETRFAQPLLFIIEYALATTLMKWGVKPHAMIGHSIGEYVAACIAGVMTLEESLMLVAVRGKLMQSMPAGSMLSISMNEAEITPYLNDRLSLAAVNSTRMCVVSGPTTQIESLQEILQLEGKFSRLLHTSHAFHSYMMEPIIDSFESAVQQVQFKAPNIPLISNLSGTYMTKQEALNPQYWTEHLLNTVHFESGIQQWLNQNTSIMIEIGPGNALSTLVSMHESYKKSHRICNTIRRSDDSCPDNEYFLRLIGELWTMGCKIDWNGYYDERNGRRIPLPAYPFQRETYGDDSIPALNEPIHDRTNLVRNPDNQWFYTFSWERAMLADTSKENKKAAACYLLFVDEHPMNDLIINQLSTITDQIIIVKKSIYFEKKNDYEFNIDPKEKEHYVLLFESLKNQLKESLTIIHLWNVNIHCGPLQERIDDTLEYGYFSLLYIAQSMGGLLKKVHTHMYIVSNNMQDVTGTDLCYPEKSVINGPCKVIPKEYENMKCTSIDIDLNEPNANVIELYAKSLFREILSNDSDQTIAYRGRYRWIQNTRPLLTEKKLSKELIRKDGTYLITGGLGELGLKIAEYIATHSQGKIVLVGRRSFPKRHEWNNWISNHGNSNPVSEQIVRLEQMEQLGVEIAVEQADVTCFDDLDNVLRRVRSTSDNIHGVVHAAGLADGTLMQNRAKEIDYKILMPKIQGTIYLKELLQDSELDFIVLCSSLASVLAPLGQVAYCAANSFLDSYSNYSKQHDGMNSISINWDRLKESGMSERSLKAIRSQVHSEYDKSIEEENRQGLDNEEVIEVFERTLSTSCSNVIVSTSDLEERLHTLTLNKDWFKRSDITSSQEDAAPVIATISEMEAIISTEYKKFFGIETVGGSDNFFDLGATSLDLIQINSRLTNVLKIDIPLTDMFMNPSIHALASALFNDYFNVYIGGKRTGQMGQTDRSDIKRASKDRMKQRLTQRKGK